MTDKWNSICRECRGIRQGEIARAEKSALAFFVDLNENDSHSHLGFFLDFFFERRSRASSSATMIIFLLRAKRRAPK